jgi:hypothetical protein
MLAIQEVHLNQEDVDDLHNLFRTHPKILFTQDTNCRAVGVAIIINKDCSMHKYIEEYEMIPGRALLAGIPWHGDPPINRPQPSECHNLQPGPP